MNRVKWSDAIIHFKERITVFTSFKYPFGVLFKKEGVGGSDQSRWVNRSSPVRCKRLS